MPVLLFLLVGQRFVSISPVQNFIVLPAQFLVVFLIGIMRCPHINQLPNAVKCVGRGCRCVITVNGSVWSEHNLERAVYQEAEKHQFTVEAIIETEYIRKENINVHILVIRR